MATGAISAWMTRVTEWHARAGPSRHCMVCDTCGAIWNECMEADYCGTTRCDDCVGDRLVYRQTSWDAIYDCRGIRALTK